MGAARQQNEAAVDEPLRFVSRGERPHAATPDVKTASSGRLSGSAESTEPPWRRATQPELFVDDSGDVGSNETEHPRSLIPERIAIPAGLEPAGWIGPALGLVLATAIGAVAGIGGYFWTFPPPGPTSERSSTSAKAVDRASVQQLATSADRQVSGSNDNAEARAAMIVAAPVMQAEQGVELQSAGISAVTPVEPSRRAFDTAQIALMLKSGSDFLANGNIGSARMMLQPAAEAGDAMAAFALAETYDPVVLQRLGVKGGISPDIAQARKWYAKSRDLGSAMAQERLVRLER